MPLSVIFLVWVVLCGGLFLFLRSRITAVITLSLPTYFVYLLIALPIVTVEEALQSATQDGELSERLILTTLYGNFNEASSSATWRPNEIELQRLYSVLHIPDSRSEYKEQVSRVLGVIDLRTTEDGSEMRAALISTRPSNPEHDCHACAVALGSAIFIKF